MTFRKALRTWAAVLLAVLLPAGPAAALSPSPPAAPVDLAVTATDSADPAEVGTGFTYRVAVRNTGPEFATGVRVTVAVSGADHTVRSASGGTGPCTLDASTVVCTISSILVGTTATVTVTVTPLAAGTLSARAGVTAGEQADSNPANDAVTETTAVRARPASADLAVTATGPTSPVPAGTGYPYRAAVLNRGPDAATAATATVTLTGADRTIATAAVDGGSCAIDPPAVRCTLGTLAAGATTTITVTVLPRAAGTITATATVAAGESDPDRGNNTGTADTTVTAAPPPPTSPSADLAVTTTGTPDPAALAGTFTSTTTVTNRGPSPATAVTATVALTGAASIVLDVNGRRGRCTTAGSTATCAVGDLARDATATITMTVEPQARGTVTASATVLGTPADPVAANNAAVRTTTVGNGLGCTIVGTAGNNVLIGSPGNDVICPLGGNDVVLAAGGNDIVHGGSGNDVVQAGTGADTVYGGPGTDLLAGGPGFDRLDGGPGRDRCVAGEILVGCHP
jgi:Ca2+-binding RTX toxin-like protein